MIPDRRERILKNTWTYQVNRLVYIVFAFGVIDTGKHSKLIYLRFLACSEYRQR